MSQRDCDRAPAPIELRDGELSFGERTLVMIEPAGPPPYGQEVEGVDSWASLEATDGDPGLVAAVDLSGDGDVMTDGG